MKKMSIPVFLFMLILALLFPLSVSANTTTAYSGNWAGYVATTTSTSGPFTSVSATWAVPAVTGPASSYSLVWVGIGGWYRNSSKLIQAGTEQDVARDGTKTYSAWYEVYPKAMVPIGAVGVGDTITVSISQNLAKTQYWHITMMDGSTTLLDKDFKVSANFASQATAEFIVEKPLLVVGHRLAPLADFSFVTFSGCTANGLGLGSLNNIEVFMTSNGSATGGTALASSTDLSGTGFTVNYVGP